MTVLLQLLEYPSIVALTEIVALVPVPADQVALELSAGSAVIEAPGLSLIDHA